MNKTRYLIKQEWYGFSLNVGLAMDEAEPYCFHIVRKHGKWTIRVPSMDEYASLQYMSPDVAKGLADALRAAIEFCHELT